jgi:Glycosyltransferase family 87
VKGAVHTRVRASLPLGVTGSSFGRRALLVAAVASSCVLVALAPRHSPITVTLAIVATVACGSFTVLELRAPLLGPRPVAAAIGVVFAVAVLTPPRSSDDLWSYSMYGRMITVHSTSPYDAVPSEFPSDPFLRRVNPIWRHRGSVFGPAFVAYAATGTLVAGDSVLANRLFFQLGATAAATAVLVIVWRKTRSPATLAWLGLNPAVGAVAVNGGHVDVLIGLGVLVGAVLCARRRAVAAGVVLGLAALIKVTALLALVGVLLWAWRRSERRIAGGALLGAATTVALGYLPVLHSASRVLTRADHTITPGSVWNPIGDAILGHNAGRLLPYPRAPNTTLDVVFYVSLAAVGVVALVGGWRASRAATPSPATGATTASYTVAGAYTYPWYCSWSLPVLTSRRPSKLAWIVWLQASAMLAALALPIHPSGSIVDDLFRDALTYLAPVALALAFVVVAVRGSDQSLGVVPTES